LPAFLQFKKEVVELIDKINIAVLGCSSIANRSVIPAILNAEKFELTHVASRSREKANEFANRSGCKACGYQDVLDNNEIDAVYVSLPVGLHYDWGIQVVQAGKHLIMEKTFTENIDKAQEIISIAGIRNVVSMEALAYVYHPVYKKVQAIIESGEIGELRHIEAFFGFPFLPEEDIRNALDLGGGAMLDALIYPLSFSLNTVDKMPLSFKYNIIRDEGQRVDSRGFVQINWDNCSAQIGYGFGFMYRNSFAVWGDKAHLRADRVFSRPPTMKGSIVITKQGQIADIDVEPADQFLNMFNAFADKISGADKSGLNEKENILERMKIISNMRDAYINNEQNSIEA
jgi:NDP-hexose-3-ketoreductase